MSVLDEVAAARAALHEPQLPAHVSANGQEIWDWAARLSEHTQRQAKKRELIADIARMKRECGSCYFWMKSRDCPKEHNVNGRNRGPSMSAPICSKFKMDPLTAKIVASKQGDLE